MLRDLGAQVIDADQLAREVVQPGQPAYAEIAQHFGSEVLQPDGRLDRARLAAVVFADDTARRRLNAITHPRVQQRMEQLVQRLAEQGYRLPVVLDIPLLIEAGMQQTVDEIWLVSVSREAQLARLMQRNSLDAASALARIEAQLPPSAKAKWATVLIDNNGSLEQTRAQVQAGWQAALDRSANYQHQRS